MTEEERTKLLQRIQERINETKKFSAEQALKQLKEEGFCVDNGTLVMMSYDVPRP